MELSSRLLSFFSLGGLCLASAGCGGDSEAADEPGTQTNQRVAAWTSSSVAASQGTRLSIRLGTKSLGVGMITGAQGVRVGDRVVIENDRGKPGPVFALGSQGIEVGADSLVGTVASPGRVTLRSRTKVGAVQSDLPLSKQDGVNHGPVSGYVDRSGLFERAVHFPGGRDVRLEPETKETLLPGSYGALTAKRAARLRLSAGTYTFTAWLTDSGARIEIDTTAGPVYVFVRDSFIARGVMDADPKATLFGVLGAGDIRLELPFSGTMVAPNARITLADTHAGPHRGTFHGKEVVIDSATKAVLIPFQSWLIEAVNVSKRNPCPNESVSVAVRAPEDAAVTIGSLPLRSRHVDFDGIAGGKRRLTVTASAPGGFTEVRTEEFTLASCGSLVYRPVVRAQPDPYSDYVLNVGVGNAETLKLPADVTYRWTIGSAAPHTTSVPVTTSDVFATVATSSRRIVPVVAKVELLRAGRIVGGSETTLAIHNREFDNAARGFVQPRVHTSERTSGNLARQAAGATWKLENPSSQALRFDSYIPQHIYCDPSREARLFPAVAASVEIPPRGDTTLSYAAAKGILPSDVCTVARHYVGRAGTLNAYVSVYAAVQTNATLSAPTTDAGLLTVLAEAERKGLLADTTSVTDAELFALALQGKLSLPNSSFELVPYQASAEALLEQECFPGEEGPPLVNPGDPKLACRPVKGGTPSVSTSPTR